MTITYPPEYIFDSIIGPDIEYSFNKTESDNGIRNYLDCYVSDSIQVCQQVKEDARNETRFGSYQVYKIDDHVNTFSLPKDNPNFCYSDCCLDTTEPMTISIKEKVAFRLYLYGKCSFPENLDLMIGDEKINDCLISSKDKILMIIDCTLIDIFNIPNNTYITFMGCGEKITSSIQVVIDSSVIIYKNRRVLLLLLSLCIVF